MMKKETLKGRLKHNVQTLEALRESEDRFRTLVESMDDIVSTLDTDQRHTGVYGRWLERSGFTLAYFIGKTAEELLKPYTAEQLFRTLRKTISEKTPTRGMAEG